MVSPLRGERHARADLVAGLQRRHGRTRRLARAGRIDAAGDERAFQVLRARQDQHPLLLADRRRGADGAARRERRAGGSAGRDDQASTAPPEQDRRRAGQRRGGRLRLGGCGRARASTASAGAGRRP
jgi:hypothetical protein